MLGGNERGPVIRRLLLVRSHYLQRFSQELYTILLGL